MILFDFKFIYLILKTYFSNVFFLDHFLSIINPLKTKMIDFKCILIIQKINQMKKFIIEILIINLPEY